MRPSPPDPLSSEGAVVRLVTVVGEVLPCIICFKGAGRDDLTDADVEAALRKADDMQRSSMDGGRYDLRLPDDRELAELGRMLDPPRERRRLPVRR
jgi:hypothetical protein